MYTGSYTLKKYIDGVGYYAMADLQVEETSDIGVNVKYDREFIDDEWQVAITFAASYFYEHFKRHKKVGLTIEIKNLHTMTGDSSNMVVVFVLIRCLTHALSFEPERSLVTFDEKTGKFNLIK